MSLPFLFCIPYAGGSASVFLKWKRPLQDLVEVVPIELAGRGARMAEPTVSSAREHGEDVAGAIAARLADEPDRAYVIWAHSMGTLVAYEAYHALRRRRERERTLELPAHMVLSGRTPPHVPVTKTEYHRFDDERFIDAVDSYGGGTASVLRSSPELRELFLPILRADFRVSETYEWTDPGVRIASALTVLNGGADRSIDHALLDRWQELAERPVTHRTVGGGHFFPFDQDDIVRETVHAVVSSMPTRASTSARKAL
ncbi:MAG: hypothetical protein K0S43_121 [Cellulosimicrobium sp.]|uniref:thioesterase II family protein n=1 Tax=Curtobacterium TaxID=2034 RepID=UPI0015E8C54E|nr:MULTISPECIES: alpha/beta fold hydrolase [Curtobacterium]MDF2805175.1 hypothetical protein [Cellulosimicrobium sp.]